IFLIQAFLLVLSASVSFITIPERYEPYIMTIVLVIYYLFPKYEGLEIAIAPYSCCTMRSLQMI
ncbi:hypothetical protein ACE1AT_21670, partial [Pelatocladus sp. BLCC-F211]|uniref:hypothetical protein n=1 Tax=Pelatocladus sp. BLCC-F211 TaxID=3342752 RepID=UPI0035BA9D82